MKEKRPSSSFRSADSKRKHGLPSSILAKAETGVSTSATRSTISGTRLPRFASSRNSSRVGEISKEDMERVTRLELATSSLARRCSTTELHPHLKRVEIMCGLDRFARL